MKSQIEKRNRKKGAKEKEKETLGEGEKRGERRNTGYLQKMYPHPFSDSSIDVSLPI